MKGLIRRNSPPKYASLRHNHQVIITLTSELIELRLIDQPAWLGKLLFRQSIFSDLSHQLKVGCTELDALFDGDDVVQWKTLQLVLLL